MRLDRFLLLLTLVFAACARPRFTEIRPSESCAGRLVLEFTNELDRPVQVGWLSAEQLKSVPLDAEPTWLGVVPRGTRRFQVPGPGRVIFRDADRSGTATESHVQVRHRLLCSSAVRS